MIIIAKRESRFFQVLKGAKYKIKGKVVKTVKIENRNTTISSSHSFQLNFLILKILVIGRKWNKLKIGRHN